MWRSSRDVSSRWRLCDSEASRLKRRRWADKGMSRVNPEIANPERCSKAELETFCDFVRRGGEVQDDGLEGRVRQAKALVFLRVDGQVIGVAAIKRPALKYRDGVFRKAGVPHAASRFHLEIGWVFVMPDHRKKGYSHALCAAAMSQAERESTFATTRLDNVAMQRTLERFGLRRLGDSWQSDRGTKPRLVLYITT